MGCSNCEKPWKNGRLRGKRKMPGSGIGIAWLDKYILAGADEVTRDEACG